MNKIAAFVWTDRSSPLRRRAIENLFDREGYTLVRLRPNASEGPLDLPAWLAAREITPHADERLVIVTDKGEWALGWYRAYQRLADDFVWLAEQPARHGADAGIFSEAALSHVGDEEAFARIHLACSFESERYVAPLVARAPRAFALLDAMDHGRSLPKGMAQKRFETPRGVVEIGVVDGAPVKPMTFALDTTPSLAPPKELELSRRPSLLPIVLSSAAGGRVPSNVASMAERAMAKMANHPGRAARLTRALLEREAHARVHAALRRMPGDPSGRALREIFSTLEGGAVPREAEIPILLSSIAFAGHYGQPHVPDASRIRDRRLAKRAAELGLTVPSFVPREGRLAILMMQMKRLPHAPTKNLFGYVRALRRYRPGLDIRVFVTDDLTYSPEENVAPELIVSEPSSAFANEHAAELAGLGVEIVYARTDLDRKRRTELDVQRIAAFAPEAVVALGAEIPLARFVLQGHVPIVSVSFGGGPPSSARCDVFASPRRPGEIAREMDASRLVRTCVIRQHEYGLDFPEPGRTITRASLGLPEDAFAVVVVGNRLMGEISGPFAEMLGAFVSTHERAHVVVVGRVDEREVTARFGVDPARVHYVPLERDLPALYRVCDVFANPFRDGGGHSIAFAMHGRVPVVSLRSSKDAMVSLRGAGGVDSPAAYLEELGRLYRDARYRAELGAIQRATVLHVYSWDRCSKDLLALVSEAKAMLAKVARQQAA